MCAREAIKTFNPSMTSLFVASIAKTARQGNRRTAVRSARLFFVYFYSTRLSICSRFAGKVRESSVGVDNLLM